jgi:hypothetical protein
MKNFCIAALLLLTATLSYAQAPTVALFTPSSDVYVGYSTTFPDYGPKLNSYRFNGIEGAYTKTFRPRIALTGSVSMVFGSVFSVKQFSGTVGPKINLLTGRIRPYITAQGGFAHQSSNGMYAGDHHPPLKAGTTDVEDGFTYRMGVGLDAQLTHKLYWRALQWDIQPQPWGRHTPYYWNFGSGIGYRF